MQERTTERVDPFIYATSTRDYYERHWSPEMEASAKVSADNWEVLLRICAEKIAELAISEQPIPPELVVEYRERKTYHIRAYWSQRAYEVIGEERIAKALEGIAV